MPKSTFGIIGLGVMGSSLAKNCASKGISVSVYNRFTEAEEDVISNFEASHSYKNIKTFSQIEEFVASLQSPRKILMMVSAGTAVDAVINQLLPLLAEKDVLIDGGNSYFKETQLRNSVLIDKKIEYLGLGISGGEKGALHGPSMMAGGSETAYENVKNILETIAAKDYSGKPCAALVGEDGSGHFVKMIHNGIEYAEMQLIAELFALLSPSLSYEEMASLFEKWQESDLKSYLLDITIKILRLKENGDYLVDSILDKASSKGTGKWSSQIALDLGVPATLISDSVYARSISMLKEKRKEFSKSFGKNTRVKFNLEALKQAYSFARIINHHQGFEVIKAASLEEYNWNINLHSVARIWTNGCIINSKLIEELSQSFKEYTSILENPAYLQMLQTYERSTMTIISNGFTQRTALPCFSSALQYWLGMTTENSPANLIQAQRDFFGAHTYKKRGEDESKSFTTNWENING